MNYKHLTSMGGGISTYSAPAVEILDVTTEKGFTNSPNYGDPGYAGSDPGGDNSHDYGDL
ncbi:hypothetical protein [uncultured Alistipes sp.]|uniref:hypothetical protein n=1 Tax=uncultured Alistipes sp. TaxID=538949 RepID=UPI0025FBE7C4|nr:hypothetical protein [uncultured Alistipes sp.]